MPALLPPRFTEAEMAELVEWLEAAIDAGAVAAGGIVAAAELARRRAGELVGMRWDADLEKWVEASRAAYRIGDDIRDWVQQTVAEAIRRGDSVSTLRESLQRLDETIEGRALTVARTESAIAYNTGSIAAYEADGVQYVDVSDGPGCLHQGHDDAAPLPIPDTLGIQEGRQADGQRWTIAEAAAWPTAHPNCVRMFLPVVPGVA